MTQQPTLKFQKDADLVILTFNRPEAHNAVDTKTATAALATVRELKNDAEARVVIITGAGKTFISGADIAEMRTKTPTQARVYSELGHTLVRAIGQLDRPVIAAINGFCSGGGMEIALAADIRSASERARFAPTQNDSRRHSRLGSTASSHALVGYVGYQRARLYR